MKPILKVDKNIFYVPRGGGWYYPSLTARVAYHSWWSPSYRGSYLGFRLFEGMI